MHPLFYHKKRKSQYYKSTLCYGISGFGGWKAYAIHHFLKSEDLNGNKIWKHKIMSLPNQTGAGFDSIMELKNWLAELFPSEEFFNAWVREMKDYGSPYVPQTVYKYPKLKMINWSKLRAKMVDEQ